MRAFLKEEEEEEEEEGKKKFILVIFRYCVEAGAVVRVPGQGLGGW